MKLPATGVVIEFMDLNGKVREPVHRWPMPSMEEAVKRFERIKKRLRPRQCLYLTVNGRGAGYVGITSLGDMVEEGATYDWKDPPEKKPQPMAKRKTKQTKKQLALPAETKAFEQPSPEVMAALRAKRQAERAELRKQVEAYAKEELGVNLNTEWVHYDACEYAFLADCWKKKEKTPPPPRWIPGVMPLPNHGSIDRMVNSWRGAAFRPSVPAPRVPPPSNKPQAIKKRRRKQQLSLDGVSL